MPESQSLRIVIGVAAFTILLVSVGTVWILKPDAGSQQAAARPVERAAPERPGTPSLSDPGESAAIAALRDALEREHAARLKMAEQIELLREDLAQSSSQPAAPNHGPARHAATTPPELGVETASEFAELWFNEQALLEVGLSQHEIEELRRQFDEVELEKLEARDRALREGWSSSSRHSRELRDIHTRFRQDIGEENYDRVLYASGRKNRVRVGDLLRGSAAEDSGVEVGDVIIRYAGQRVFDPSTLYIWTTKGDFGESIILEVQRGNETIRLAVPRGPLGGKLVSFATPPGS